MHRIPSLINKQVKVRTEAKTFGASKWYAIHETKFDVNLWLFYPLASYAGISPPDV